VLDEVPAPGSGWSDSKKGWRNKSVRYIPASR